MNKRTVITDRVMDTILNDPIFQGWYEYLRTQKETTAQTYKYGLVAFCDFTGKTPSQLIDEAREDYLKRVAPWELRHQKRFQEFIQMLRTDTQYSNNTKGIRIKSVKHFYQHHRIPLMPEKTGIPHSPCEEYLDTPVLIIEDIRKAVLATGTNLQLKALILIFLSSGQAQAEVRKLKGKHLKNIQDGIAVVNFMRGKTKNFRYTFFIGKDALDAIREYKPNLGDDEYVFTQQNSPKPLTAQEVDGIFFRHAEKLGFDRSYFAPHRFRHFYDTTLTGEMDSTYIQFTMAHTLPGVKSSYFKGEELEKMKLAYLKCQHLLTVFTEKEVLQKQYDELKQKRGTETDRIESLETELSEIRQKMVDETRLSEIVNGWEETKKYLKLALAQEGLWPEDKVEPVK